MVFIPAPIYSCQRAAWIPRLVVWMRDGRFRRLEGAAGASYGEAFRASWRLSRPRDP